MSHLIAILEYIVDSFIHIWPYLLITIPIAVAVQMSGAAKYINRAFSARPVIAILLATAVGAFSPLCSCSVIPVVAAMLIGGVPLAPVMSFWLASPSMDPEIFFLTVGTLGWELASWRLAATLLLSLGGGFLTHFVVQRGWLGENILRKNRSTQVRTIPHIVMDGVRRVLDGLVGLQVPNFGIVPSAPIALEAAVCCDAVQQAPGSFEPSHQLQATSMAIGTDNPSLSLPIVQTEVSTCATTCSGEPQVETPFWRRLAGETWTATTMVIKFMLLAWFVGALVKLYVPEEWITGVLSGDNPWSIMTAAFLGVPVYTSNLAAMPLVGGLLALGMHPSAALAFLIAGPITTLPAMSAVWGLVNRKVFALYIGFALVGAVLLGYAYNIALRI
jgi:uncharacterized membrane protein YraQ (UPF0718 family)